MVVAPHLRLADPPLEPSPPWVHTACLGQGGGGPGELGEVAVLEVGVRRVRGHVTEHARVAAHQLPGAIPAGAAACDRPCTGGGERRVGPIHVAEHVLDDHLPVGAVARRVDPLAPAERGHPIGEHREERRRTGGEEPVQPVEDSRRKGRTVEPPRDRAHEGVQQDHHRVAPGPRDVPLGEVHRTRPVDGVAPRVPGEGGAVQRPDVEVAAWHGGEASLRPRAWGSAP